MVAKRKAQIKQNAVNDGFEWSKGRKMEANDDEGFKERKVSKKKANGDEVGRYIAG